jgi:hypothetical protein
MVARFRAKGLSPFFSVLIDSNTQLLEAAVFFWGGQYQAIFQTTKRLLKAGGGLKSPTPL